MNMNHIPEKSAAQQCSAPQWHGPSIACWFECSALTSEQ